MADTFWFDEKAATVAERFFDRLLTHVEGPLAGEPFVLEPWQRKIVRDIFGWKREDGSRKYRKLYLEVARGNGKSTLAAGFALFMLIMDGEYSAKIYSAATDRGTAKLVYETAEKMVDASPHLKKLIRKYRNRTMIYKKMASEYVVLSADAGTKEGLNPHGILFDELHAQPNRKLYDVLNTALGKRKQPLMVMMTTAGYDRNSICWQVHEYARQVAEGVIDDPSFYPAIFAASEDDDWTDPATWAKANPNMGKSVREEHLAQECATALASPYYQNTFKRYYLNIWTSQESRWLNMEYWDKCSTPLPDLTGRVCYGGLDLSATTDLSAFVLAFPPQQEDEPIWLLPTIWVPKDDLIARGQRDHVPYDAWVRDGYIKATAGNVIDYDVIYDDIITLAGKYKIVDIAFDNWNAITLSTKLNGELGEDKMLKMGQGYQSMSAPTKEMLRMVLSEKIGHGGHPVMRWAADNMVVVIDAAGNVKPTKEANKQPLRIDPIVASIMAIDRLTRHLGEPERKSVYDTRGVLTL